ncbi:diguanylate cyclase (GGDEF domain) [hydrothermal vent metagenome]|uniref:Diguanylate cyclase (GGDEF domain) n=1 Tax=hydrothermal vent metagenome TaxID=652676 RepID=A0A3B1CDF3_9ZZZZ
MAAAYGKNPVLQKYKDRADHLQKLVESHEALVSSAVNHIKILAKGDADLEKGLDAVVSNIKGAKTFFQIEKARLDYIELLKKLNAHVQERSSKSGGFFSSIRALFQGGSEKQPQKKAEGKEAPSARGGPIELVDSSREILTPYISLLESFSKGTMLLSDDNDPFFSSLVALRRSAFSELKDDKADSLSLSLYNFYIRKSNEAATIENERGELKKIISSLTGYIQSVAVSSASFGGKLDQYSQKIMAASDLQEIKDIQHHILTETLEIQKINSAVRDQLAESEIKLNQANEKILRLEQNLEMARQEKSTDQLTQVFNRRFFDETMEKTIANFERYGEESALIMMDIDHFKKFNDTYGHIAGDQVIRTVADITRESVRVGDIVARYGGEEFVVILNHANLKDAAKVAETIRKNVKAHEFGVGGKTVHATVSLGVAEFTKGDTSKQVVERSDKRLYMAKKGGRDRVFSSDE